MGSKKWVDLMMVPVCVNPGILKTLSPRPVKETIVILLVWSVTIVPVLYPISVHSVPRDSSLCGGPVRFVLMTVLNVICLEHVSSVP